MDTIQSANLVARSVGLTSPLLTKAKTRDGAPRIDGLLAVPIAREAQRARNQRHEDRLPGLVSRGTLHFRYCDYAVEILNFSSGGLMIASTLLPYIGETVEMLVDDHGRFRCTVRWVRGGRIGLEFEEDGALLGRSAAERIVLTFSQAKHAPAHERPFTNRAKRRGLLRAGHVQADGKAVPVRLKNVSPQGAMIESDCRLTPGTEVRLDLSGAFYLVAEVRWSDGSHVGLKFAEEIDLDPLFARTDPQPVGHSPKMLVPDYLKNETSPDSPWASRWATLSQTDLKPLADGAPD